MTVINFSKTGNAKIVMINVTDVQITTFVLLVLIQLLNLPSVPNVLKDNMKMKTMIAKIVKKTVKHVLMEILAKNVNPQAKFYLNAYNVKIINITVIMNVINVLMTVKPVQDLILAYIVKKLKLLLNANVTISPI